MAIMDRFYLCLSVLPQVISVLDTIKDNNTQRVNNNDTERVATTYFLNYGIPLKYFKGVKDQCSKEWCKFGIFS